METGVSEPPPQEGQRPGYARAPATRHLTDRGPRHAHRHERAADRCTEVQQMRRREIIISTGAAKHQRDRSCGHPTTYRPGPAISGNKAPHPGVLLPSAQAPELRPANFPRPREKNPMLNLSRRDFVVSTGLAAALGLNARLIVTPAFAQ